MPINFFGVIRQFKIILVGAVSYLVFTTEHRRNCQGYYIIQMIGTVSLEHTCAKLDNGMRPLSYLKTYEAYVTRSHKPL